MSLLPAEQCPNSWIRDQLAPCIRFDRCYDLGVILFLNEITRASLVTPLFGSPRTVPKPLFPLHPITKLREDDRHSGCGLPHKLVWFASDDEKVSAILSSTWKGQMSVGKRFTAILFGI
jgi:hypothetical protein